MVTETLFESQHYQYVTDTILEIQLLNYRTESWRYNHVDLVHGYCQCCISF